MAMTRRFDVLYRGPDGSVSRPVGLIDQPCVVLANVETGAETTVVVDCERATWFECFERLAGDPEPIFE